MRQTCDRCGRGEPYVKRFWATLRMGLLCDDCNTEWAVFRDFWLDAAQVWQGDVLTTTRRKLNSLQRQLEALQRE